MRNIKSGINSATKSVHKTATMLKKRLSGILPNGLGKGLPQMPNTSQLSRRSLVKHFLSHWLHVIWKDLFWILKVLGVIYYLNKSNIFKPKDRIFPMWLNPNTQLWEGPVEFSYPHISMILSTFNCAIAVMVIPLAVIFIMQLFVRSFWDLNAAIMGLLKSMTLM